jgi:hypothetical protein
LRGEVGFQRFKRCQRLPEGRLFYLLLGFGNYLLHRTGWADALERHSGVIKLLPIPEISVLRISG